MADVIHRTTLEFRHSVGRPVEDFPEPTWKHNPNMTAVGWTENAPPTVPSRYWKAPADWDAVGAGPVEMSAGEKTTVDAAILTAQRDATAARLTLVEDVLRAVLLELLSELNLHAAQHNAVLDAIDNNATLATIKTAIAAIPDYPTRTEAQLRTGHPQQAGDLAMVMDTMTWTARDFERPSTAFPAFDIVQDREFLGFDDTTQETCYTPHFTMPASYAAGTLTATVIGFFAAEITATDEAVMSVSVEAVTVGDALDLDATTSFDTENTGLIVPPGTAGHAASIGITLTNKDAVAVGDTVRLRVRRNPADAADTCGGDFRMLSVHLSEA